MPHVSNHREKFISMLKDSVLTLCKNGLTFDNGITKVEGLIGITLQNNEVFLINIKEELVPAPASFPCPPETVESAGSKVTESKTPPLSTHAIGERRGSEVSRERNRIPTCVKRPRRSPPHDLANRGSGGGGKSKDRQEIESESCFVLEETGSEVRLFDASENRSSFVRGPEQDGDDVCSVDDQEVEADVSTVERSSATKAQPQMKDESEELLFNLSNSMINQLQNYDNGQALISSSNLMHWPKDNGVPQSLIPSNYLASMLSFPGHGSSPPSQSPPPFRPGLHHPFYGSPGSGRAPVPSQRHPFKIATKQNRKYCCDHCNYKSNRSYNLLRHVMHVHAPRNFSCTDCGVAFSNNAQWREHRLQQHDSDDALAFLSMVKQEPREEDVTT